VQPKLLVVACFDGTHALSRRTVVDAKDKRQGSRQKGREARAGGGSIDMAWPGGAQVVAHAAMVPSRFALPQ
jgi:hypothetical protein